MSEPIVADELLGGNGELHPPKPPETDVQGSAPIVAQELIDPRKPVELGEIQTPVTPPPIESTPVTPAPPQTAPVCNCGKQPGKRGPHAVGCPVRNSGFRGNGVRLNTQGQQSVANPGSGDLNPQSQVVLPNTQSTVTDNSAAVALVCFEMGTSALQVAFGPEWKAENDDEKNACVSSLANYFRTKKIEDVPPGVLCACVLGAYAAKRVSQPNTKTKLVNMYLWVKPKLVSTGNWLKGLFRKKTA